MKNIKKSNKKIMLISLCLATMMTMTIFVPISTGAPMIENKQTLLQRLENNYEMLPTGRSELTPRYFENERLLASDGMYNDRFGSSVAIDGDVAIIGAPYGDGLYENTGYANIYRFNGTGWNEEAKVFQSGLPCGHYFGYAVDINNDVAVVGATFETNENGLEAGAAYIFQKNGSSWEEVARIIASDGENYDYFGCSVSIENDMVLVGTYNGDGVYVFNYNGSAWVEMQKILPSGQSYTFGNAVDFKNDIAVIGDSWAYGTKGTAYIFSYNGEHWIEEQQLIASDTPNTTLFGSSVCLDENTIIIGADYSTIDNNEYAGAAYIYQYNGDSWEEITKLTASDGAAWDNFGCSVDIDDDTIIIGALNHLCDGKYYGSAYVYKSDGSSWVETAKLIDSESTTDDGLVACCVAINDGAIFLGNPHSHDQGAWSGCVSIYYDLGMLAGDVNIDGMVNIDDIMFILDHWGESGGPGDANRDGKVNFDDIMLVLGYWT